MALSFAFDPQKGETPATIKEKRDLVRALMGASRAPQNVGEGLNALGDGIVAAVLDKRASAAEAAGMESWNNDWSGIAAALGGGDFPEAPVAGGAPVPEAGLTLDAAQADFVNSNPQPGGYGAEVEMAAAGGAPSGMEPYRNAIAGIESGGRYDIVGPTHPKLGRALGKYQVMEANVGPWSEAALGRRVTPDEFLANPQLQDAIFDHQFGQYVQKYGPEQAAQAWFAGEGGIGKTGRKDVLGTTVGSYGNRFMQALGASGAETPAVAAANSVIQEPAQVASLDPTAGFPEAPDMASTPNPGIVAALTQGGEQAPIQMAQAGIPVMAGGDAPPIASPNIEQLLRAAQNPFAPPAAQGIVKLLMEQEMQKRDPRYNLELENLRGQMDDRQIDNRREDARFGFEQDKFKTEAELEREKFEWEKGKPTDDIREYEFYEKRAREAGQQPLGPLEWDIMRRKAAAPSMSQTMGGPDDSELRKKLDGKTGELWSTFEEQGANSAAMVQDMQVLDELIKVAPQGPLQGRLAEAFPGFSSAGDAFQSIVKRVAPTLRAPGSGSTSDIEYDGMLRSLPALRNRPEANALIAEIMKAKAAINIERADIVARFAQEDISVKEARRQMGELNKRSIMSPEMKQLIEGVGGGQASDVPLPGDIVDEYRFLGGNPGDPSSWEKVE